MRRPPPYIKAHFLLHFACRGQYFAAHGYATGQFHTEFEIFGAHNGRQGADRLDILDRSEQVRPLGVP